MAPIIDKLISYGADRLVHARREWMRATKGHESQLPAYLGDPADWYNKVVQSATLEERSRIALTVSWIYADIKLIANEFSAAKLEVRRKGNEDRLETDKSHPFMDVLAHPNSEMDLPFLLQYMAYWMMLRGKAYWFLAPEVGNPEQISEIWPIRSDRIFPVTSKTKFIEKYIYKTSDGRQIAIDPRYVVFFRTPNPFDLWDGLSPLTAWLPVETERGLAQWQKDTYTTGRGIPHSVIALSQNLGETDFITAAARIREDFEQERKVAITRSGDLKVETVGITPRDLELIKSRDFTRDEIDTIFLGVPIRDHSSDVWLEAADKVIKEKTIRPMHVLIAGQLTIQVLKSFYQDDIFMEFEDIRPQDRALNVQEANVYWKVYKVNEAREKLGLPKIELPKFMDYEFENYGELPVTLAADPAFVTLLYDIGRIGPDDVNMPGGADTLDRYLDKVNQVDANRQLSANKPKPDPSLRQAEGPKRTTNRVATQGTAAQSGKKSELRRWKKVALKEHNEGNDPSSRWFVTDILSEHAVLTIKSLLAECETEESIRDLFDKAIEAV